MQAASSKENAWLVKAIEFENAGPSNFEKAKPEENADAKSVQAVKIKNKAKLIIKNIKINNNVKPVEHEKLKFVLN